MRPSSHVQGIAYTHSESNSELSRVGGEERSNGRATGHTAMVLIGRGQCYDGARVDKTADSPWNKVVNVVIPPVLDEVYPCGREGHGQMQCVQ